MTVPVCHESRPGARPFVVTPYEPDAEGRLVPAMPSEGPCSGSEGGACRLVRHSWRARVTGPEFSLLVVRCLPHERHFTLYPPGHAPYQRVALAPVGTDGGVVQGLPQGAQGWRGTLFDAALDAQAGVAWARPWSSDSGPWWGTQGRWLARCEVLCGVARERWRGWRETVAEILAVPCLVLRDLVSGRSGSTAGYRDRGRAVCAVLDVLGDGRAAFERLAQAGAAGGLWGPPLRWHPGAGVLRRGAYRLPDTRGPPASEVDGDETQRK